MVPFNLQAELSGRQTAFFAEQLKQLTDEVGFMRYEVKTFNHRAVICVNMEEQPLNPEDITGYGEDETFSQTDVQAIAAAIRNYNATRKLNFDQMAFDF